MRDPLTPAKHTGHAPEGAMHFSLTGEAAVYDLHTAAVKLEALCEAGAERTGAERTGRPYPIPYPISTDTPPM